MGLPGAMLDRLTVKDPTIQSMCEGLHQVVLLEDPVGSMGKTWIRPNGLEVSRMRIPLGVIALSTNPDPM